MKNKTRLYLAKTVHTITLRIDIGLQYNLNSPNHLVYNSVHTAFCVPPWYIYPIMHRVNLPRVFLPTVERVPQFPSKQQGHLFAVGIR